MNTTEFNFVKYDAIQTPQIEVLLKKVDQLDGNPKYLQYDSIKSRYWKLIYRNFSSQQFFIFDHNTLVAVVNCVPLHLTKNEISNLSDDGWRWALEKSFADGERGLTANTLCCLSIKTNKDYSQSNLQQYIIQQLKNIATQQQFTAIISPIRPKMKQFYPLQDITNYAQWINNYGLPYDVGIRTHVKNGAVIAKACIRSMQIEGSVAQWEEWTGFTFQTTGEYILPKALSPLRINVELNKGHYNEPHIWMLYRL